MKYHHLLIFKILLIAAVLPVFSQDANKWLRVNFEDKGLSVAVPRTNIIDTEKRDQSQRLRIVAFENGVEMEIYHRKPNFIPGFVGSIDEYSKAAKEYLKVGDFTVLKSSPVISQDKRIRRSLIFIKDKNYYSLIVRSKTGTEKEVERFLLSIRIEGKPLIVKDEETNFQEESVSASSLETSPEIIEAEKRKTGTIEGKVSYELLKTDADDLETGDLTHRALIVEKPFPRHTPTTGFTGETEQLNVLLKVQFRADGQIGDIVVFSNAEKSFTKNSINSVRRIKFVPARRGGEFVDSFQMISYSMISVPSPTITIR